MEIIGKIFAILAMAILAALVIAFGIIEIYVWVNYGGLPASEIPGWVWWFMFS